MTDSTGAFIVPDVPEGIYVLTIAGGMKSITGIAEVTKHVIDVVGTAEKTSFPLRLRDTGCYRTEFQSSDCQIEGIIYENGIPIRFCTKG